MSKVVSATRRAACPFIGENTPSGAEDDDDHEEGGGGGGGAQRRSMYDTFDFQCVTF